jgi:uncharacterized protein (UPF0210 family)
MAYYVYELRDPRTDAVFYIGKGKGPRLDQHEKDARAGRQSRKCDRIREIESAGFKVQKRKVKNFADEQDAFDFEAEHIEAMGLGNLTNIIPGGGTASGRPTLATDRVRIRAAAFMVKRTGNGRVSALLVNGRKLDLLPLIENAKKGAIEVITRRGVEWANAVAKNLDVRFVING